MKKLLPLIFLIVILLPSCSERLTKTEFMMDTVITYDILHDDPENLISAANGRVREIEKDLSAHLENSAVTRFSRGGDVEFPDYGAEILRIALEVSAATDGAYDITVAPIVQLWDITGDNFTPPDESLIESTLPLVGYDRLTLDGNRLTAPKGTRIDLGGIAKGYACGLCAASFNGEGAVGTVNFGGNVAAFGSKDGGFRIGIKDPAAPDTLCGVLCVDSGILAVSGGYERYAEYDGVRYHHIIDPETGYPSSSDLASAAVYVPTVDGASGALADALSTAIFVMGRDKSLELYASGKFDFEAVLIGTDGSVTVTDGIGDRFTKQ